MYSRIVLPGKNFVEISFKLHSKDLNFKFPSKSLTIHKTIFNEKFGKFPTQKVVLQTL